MSSLIKPYVAGCCEFALQADADPIAQQRIRVDNRHIERALTNDRKTFDPETPSKDTLAGINVEMQGTIDPTVKPALPSLLLQLPNSDIQSIDFEIKGANNHRDLQS